MKNYKGNMLLVELVIAILFFSLSQVVIMQVFATSQQMANESKLLHKALNVSEDVAEQLSGESQPDAMLLSLGFMGGNGSYILADPAGFDLHVDLTRLEQPAGQMIRATLSVRREQQLLFSFPSAYYIAKEVQP
ncbi:MAG: hypothetical protein RR653_00725 [Clostridia bacterium]